MKVYFVVKEPSEETVNHFVESLGKALEARGCEVVYGLERLWRDGVQECNIVHFQWPEGIFGLFGHRVTDDELARVEQRLAFLKDKGIKIFVQVHNLKPHRNKDKNVLRLYELLNQQADVLVHMGNYSRELLQPQYPGARHIVIPHHIYDNILPFSVSQQEARQRLHLPQDKKIILCFGKFRNNRERELVLSILPSFHSSIFLIPGFYRETLHTRNPKKFVIRLYNTLRYRLKGIQFSSEVIPDGMMQCYFCAADVVLIQRLDILNSGNLPMAYAAGKVVVGPDTGNVGGILRDTGNNTFDPEHIESAVDALQKALENTSKGKANKAYAAKHWSSDIIATKLLKYYQMSEKEK